MKFTYCVIYFPEITRFPLSWNGVITELSRESVALNYQATLSLNVKMRLLSIACEDWNLLGGIYRPKNEQVIYSSSKTSAEVTTPRRRDLLRPFTAYDPAH